MTTATVKNKKGTADRIPPTGCQSWLDFWEQKNDGEATFCQNTVCGKGAVLGAHVIESGQGGKEYIVPLCDGCNKKDEEFSVPIGAMISVA